MVFSPHSQPTPIPFSDSPALTTPPNRKDRRNTPVPLFFALPAFCLYAALFLLPTAAGMAYAFTDWDGLSSPRFVGLDNFRRVFSDGDGRGALVHTVQVASVYVVAVNVLGLTLALGLNRALKSRNLLRVLFFAPATLGPLAIAYMWQYILQPNGPLNLTLEAAGMDGLAQPWLGQDGTALWAIVAVMVWQFVGLNMVIYLAGLGSIDKNLEEAAAVDGAGLWRRFVDITLPQLAPALTINLVLSVITGLKVFDQVIALTGGGPGAATETLATQVYEEAFVSNHFGYSAALAVMLTVGVAMVAVIQVRVMRGRSG